MEQLKPVVAGYDFRCNNYLKVLLQKEDTFKSRNRTFRPKRQRCLGVIVSDARRLDLISIIAD